jgi:26S proteasome regulatory subunit T5
MELDEKPTEDYSDIGGADKQIQELIEAVVLPMTHAHRFKSLGIRPPKVWFRIRALARFLVVGDVISDRDGSPWRAWPLLPHTCWLPRDRLAQPCHATRPAQGVLLHGPPGTGKTLLARACAKSTDAVFLKLAGPSLVQMFIGDGAKLVRDAFELAKEKCKDRGGAIIFIDEIDAIGTKRFDSDQSGDREVQRTMLELLNQLDGFSSDNKIKVIAATNRPDTLDPALLRSGRLDRKIELPLPTEDARARILQIHSRKMNVDKDGAWLGVD